MKKSLFTVAMLTSILGFAQEKQKTDTTKVSNIQEVMMTKKVFKKESDRFVYDVSNAPAAKGNTTFEVLKQTPLLSSTDDKTFRIAGKNNALVYINGRKSNMDTESLASFLKNTPAENIQKIEVITMPGSEYQVEASDGIINIVLKKKTTDGWNGNMRMANTQSKFNNQSASFSTNYRKDKFGLSANLSGGSNTEAQNYILRNGNTTSTNESIGKTADPNKNLGGYINMDYQLNDKSNIALTWNTWANKSYDSRMDFFNTIRTFDKDKNLWETSHTLTKNKENASSYNNNFNLNYELKTDSLGSKLNLNAAYLNYRRFQTTDNFTYLSTVDQNPYQKSQYVYQNMPQKINNFSAMADYIQKFKGDFTLSVGGNYNHTETDNDSKNITTVYDENGNIADLKDKNGNKLENPKFEPNHFVYTENIFGTYITAEKKFSEKFSGKVGTRFEYTKSLGTSDNAPDPSLAKIDRNYSNWLPYVSMNYVINDNNNVSYAFSSRMRRPSFWELNPVRNILTDTNYTQNNPFVKASSSYNQELTYMYKNSYFLILNHSLMQDVITQVPLQGIPTRPDGTTYEKHQLRYIRTNFGDKQEMSLTFGIQKSLFKQYWTTNFNVGVQRNINDGGLSIDPTSGDKFPEYRNDTKSTSFFVQTNNTIRLDKAKTWFAGINFFYVDKQQIELGLLKGLASLDLSIKKIWNDWTFALNATDILKTNVVEIEDYQANGNYNYVYNDQFRRNVSLSVVYNFGNQKIKKMRSVNSAADEIRNRTR